MMVVVLSQLVEARYSVGNVVVVVVDAVVVRRWLSPELVASRLVDFHWLASRQFVAGTPFFDVLPAFECLVTTTVHVHNDEDSHH